MRKIILTGLILLLAIPIIAQTQTDVTTTPITVVLPALKLVTGAGANKVLTSDASGNGTWQAAAGGDSSWNIITLGSDAENVNGKITLIEDTGETGDIYISDGDRLYITGFPIIDFGNNFMKYNTYMRLQTWQINGTSLYHISGELAGARYKVGSTDYTVGIFSGSNNNKGIVLDIEPHASADGLVKIGDTGTADEYSQTDSLGWFYTERLMVVDWDTTTHDINVKDGAAWSVMDAGGGWVTSSDSALKENFVELSKVISPLTIANKMLNVPVYRFNFKKSTFEKKFDYTKHADWDSLTTEEKTAREIEWNIAMNKNANRKSQQKKYGFKAQEFGAEFLNNPELENIDWQLVATIQWYMIQELIKTVKDHEVRLRVLEP